jgi:hypothetical protein
MAKARPEPTANLWRYYGEKSSGWHIARRRLHHVIVETEQKSVKPISEPLSSLEQARSRLSHIYMVGKRLYNR